MEPFPVAGTQSCVMCVCVINLSAPCLCVLYKSSYFSRGPTVEETSSSILNRSYCRGDLIFSVEVPQQSRPPPPYSEPSNYDTPTYVRQFQLLINK